MGVILHVDMDAFYASVEAERRDLEDEPIVVCVYSGRTEDSGAVSTCSYEARELGIHAAMPIKNAKKIADNSEKNVNFVGMDKEYYDRFSDRIKDEILAEHAEKIEKASIDEFYLELPTENFQEAEKTAGKIRDHIPEEFGVTASVGVASNKLVAKIASDQEKPEGLTVVRPEKVEEFMQSLELDEIHGIGEKTAEKLRNIGINSVKELSEAETSLLVREFGEKQGLKLQAKARGEDDAEVSDSMQKQVTRITTLDQNTRGFEKISSVFEELSQDIVDFLEEKDVDFGSVTLIVIDTDIEMHTRSTSLKARIRDQEKIVEVGENLLEEFLNEEQVIVRRVGLRVSDLKKRKGQRSMAEFT